MTSEDQQIHSKFVQQLICPITYQIIIHPVATDQGHTFDRQAITKWMRSSMKSPLSGLKLGSKILTQNILIRKTIQNSNKIRMLPLQLQYKLSDSNLIKSNTSLNQQINMYNNQIKDILNQKGNEKHLTYKQDIIQKHQLQQNQFIKRQNQLLSSKRSLILNSNNQQNKRLQQIIKALTEIIFQFETQDHTQDRIHRDQIYLKLDLLQRQVVGYCNNNMQMLSQNAYKLNIEYQISFSNLIKYNWPQIQFLRLSRISVNHQLQIFLQNVHIAFPNLKILMFNKCELGTREWRQIINKVDNLKHIQSLDLYNNKIQNITLDELKELDKISQLNYFCIKNNRFLTKQSRANLREFKDLRYGSELKIHYA